MLKKIAAAWISWVILLGFMASIATGIFIWGRKRAELATEITINYVEGNMECRKIRLDAECKTGELSITNKGLIGVDKIKLFKKNEETKSEIIEDRILPGETKKINIGSDFKKVEVIPIINVKDELIGCSDKKINLVCEE